MQQQKRFRSWLIPVAAFAVAGALAVLTGPSLSAASARQSMGATGATVGCPCIPCLLAMKGITDASLLGEIPDYCKSTNAPLRYARGENLFSTTDLGSSGFGGWGNSRALVSDAAFADGSLGPGWRIIERFQLVDIGAMILFVKGGVPSRYFANNGNGTYSPQLFFQETLLPDALAHTLTFTDLGGHQWIFYDFSGSWAVPLRGKFKSYRDPAGSLTTTIYGSSPGPAQNKLLEIQQTDANPAIFHRYLYDYYLTGVEIGQLNSVTLRRSVSGIENIVRKVNYTYYQANGANGPQLTLQRAKISDGVTDFDTKYYRYDVLSPAGLLPVRYVVEPHGYERLKIAAGGTDALVDGAADSLVATYADFAFTYDGAGRVIQEVVQGKGCGCGSGGARGTYTYAYADATHGQPDGPNVWRYKTTETLPDGNQNILYTNAAGETMLDITKDATSGLQWRNYIQYDSSGRAIFRASPSAVTNHSEALPALVSAAMLQASSGMIRTWEYYPATDLPNGAVAGYRKSERIQQGTAGTPIPQLLVKYTSRVGSSGTTYPVASETTYRNADGTGAMVTSFSYTWLGSTNHIQQRTTTLPAATALQNGPATSDTLKEFFDSSGRMVWFTNEDGFISKREFDPLTSSITRVLKDVNTALTPDEPAGWITPAGGGLHLETLTEVDYLGRTTKLTDPVLNITYTTFNDVTEESRTYPGWIVATNLPTGPTQVTRWDKIRGYRENLTMSTPPAQIGGRPTGAEPIAAVQTLTRSYLDLGDRDTYRDVYFDFTGMSYLPDINIGTQGVNFNRTLLSYDTKGRLEKVQDPTGTLWKTVFDSRDRVASRWIGTTDLNLVKVEELQYDNGTVGDDNLTQSVQFPNTSGLDDRKTQIFYDWRRRPMATKRGVQTTEATTLQRSIVYCDYDNLDRCTSLLTYDGDAVTITFTAGVPNKPSASLLRARKDVDFDEKGVQFRQRIFSVDQTTGAVSSAALTTDVWSNRRGQTIKVRMPNGPILKVTYDGIGRETRKYLTDGGGDVSWSDAGTVTGDIVLVQEEIGYDGNSLPILDVTRERFHDAGSFTGALGTPGTDPKARVTSSACYFDPASRATTLVTVGTNGGAAWSRPTSPPAPSDTIQVASFTYASSGWRQDTIDPRGFVTRTEVDRAGRPIKTIEAYDPTVNGGNPSGTRNRTTERTFNPVGDILTIKATLPSGTTSQTTRYVYGVTTANGSDLTSNRLLLRIEFPDKTTGLPSASATAQHIFTYTATMHPKTFQDQNGTVHTYTYDVMGRQTKDSVTTLGTGVNGFVRRQEAAFDSGGHPYLFTSYSTATGSTVRSQVKQVYNGLGDVITEYQANGGAVVDASTPKVQYAYSEMAGGVNHDRLTKTTYPNGRIVRTEYAAGMDDLISRVSFIADDNAGAVGTHLEDYTYLSLQRVARRAHPQIGIDLSMIKLPAEPVGTGGDQYTGWDLFNRVVDQRWIYPATSNHSDRFRYAYDRAALPLYKENAVQSTRSELYHENGLPTQASADALDRMPAVKRGLLSASGANGTTLDTVAAPTRSQSWSLDQMGNWTSISTDGASVARTHNSQNEITSIAGSTTPTYDNEGNTKKDQLNRNYTYDAWNRVSTAQVGGSTETYRYDALNRRNLEETKQLYYSLTWHVLEERVSNIPRIQYVWTPLTADSLVLRDFDSDNNGSLEQRHYAQQDSNLDITSIVDVTGNVVERYQYDAYGARSILAPDGSARASSLFSWIYGHQGGRYNSSATFLHFRNRDLHPILGRWLQGDPLGYVNGQNLYQYVLSNPHAWRDPLGLDASGEGEGSGGGQSNCYRYSIRGVIADSKGDGPAAAVSNFLAKLGAQDVTIKFNIDRRECLRCCESKYAFPFSKGDKRWTQVNFGLIIEGTLTNPEFGADNVKFVAGWYGRLGGSFQGTVIYRDECGKGSGTVCGSVFVEAGLMMLAKIGPVEVGARAGANIQLTGCVEIGVGFRARACFSVRARVWAKFTGWIKWEYVILEGQWNICTPWTPPITF